MNITKELSYIYKAKDCTDLIDTENALNHCRSLARRAEIHGRPVAKIYMRIISLKKRLKYFQGQKNQSRPVARKTLDLNQDLF